MVLEVQNSFDEVSEGELCGKFTTGCLGLVSKGSIVCAITLNVSEFTTDFAS